MAESLHHAWRMGHLEWLELALFTLLGLAALVLLANCLWQACARPKAIQPRPAGTGRWRTIPEMQLLFVGLPLQLLWEIAQFPLYTVWHEGSWSYILYGLGHCTLGDLLILLVAFELTALVARTRYWHLSAPLRYTPLLTGLGLAYTVYSETINVRVKGTWGYTELMPVVPGIEIGGMPFLQWLLIPAVLVVLMRALVPVTAVR